MANRRKIERCLGRDLWEYQILGEVYRGSVSVVSKALAPDDKTVALKFLNVDQPNYRQARGLFRREAILMSRMNHRRLVKFIDYYPEVYQPAIVMDYFDNRNVKLCLLQKDPLIREKGLNIMLACLEGLAYLHEELGYVHRDIKPENILVNDEGDSRLVDFSIACRVGRGGLPFFRKIAGTRTYIAPETIRRHAPCFQTDLYSLGCTFYEMIALEPPFKADAVNVIFRKHLNETPKSLKHHVPEINPEVERIILQMLAKKPDERPESCRAVISRLSRVDSIYLNGKN